MARLSKMYSQKQINEIKDGLIAKYGNKCFICKRGREQFKNALNLDHNHQSGAIRGLLCFYCNKYRVGRNNIKTAEDLYNYMKEFETNPIIIPSNKKSKKSKKKT